MAMVQKDVRQSDNAAFIRAVKSMDESKVSSFLDVGFDFTRARDESGRTALMLSINRPETAVRLIKEAFRMEKGYEYLCTVDKDGKNVFDHATEAKNIYLKAVINDSLLLGKHLVKFKESFPELDPANVIERIADYETNPGRSTDTIVRNLLTNLKNGNIVDASSMLIVMSMQQNGG